MKKKIVITESQYRRVFLKEAELPPAPTDKFVYAQNQWKMYGAENPKTGRNLIPSATIDKLRLSYNNAVEKWKTSNPTKSDVQSKYDLPKVDRGDTESGGIASSMKQSGFVYGDYGYETSKSKKEREESFKKISEEIPYFQAVDYNKNINEQKKLIPQYCKKPNLTKTYYEFVCDNDTVKCSGVDMKRYNTLQKKYKGRFGWYQTNKKAGILKYGMYLEYTTNPGKDPFVFCANKTSKGVWVYDTEAGPLCGCYVSSGTEFLDELGKIQTEEYVFGWLDKIKKYEASKGPSGLEKMVTYLSDCFSDYHCVLDLASIAALAIPGVGLAVSAGLDFVNASTYGIEAYNADTPEERDAAIIAGGLTLFGGLLGGGVTQTRKLLTVGAANPKVYKYVDEVIGRINKEIPQLTNVGTDITNRELVKIYKETATKYGLKQSEILVAHDILEAFSLIDPKLAKSYGEALNVLDSKIGRTNLIQISEEPAFKKLVIENNGDVVTSLNKFMKTTAGKEALQELGLFVTLTEVMEDPIVKEWVAESVLKLKSKLRPSISNLVKSYGYDWETTKTIFGSTGTYEDNTLLKKAWESGWRPWPEGLEPKEEYVTNSKIWLLNHPEFQTKKFKGEMKLFTKTDGADKIIRKVAPADPKDREEGVTYYHSQEAADAFNNMDDNITPEESKETYETLDEYL